MVRDIERHRKPLSATTKGLMTRAFLSPETGPGDRLFGSGMEFPKGKLDSRLLSLVYRVKGIS
jgi:hypothetical protein